MHAAGRIGERSSSMPRDMRDDKKTRSVVLHFEQGTSSVDGFACSACDWFYLFTTSESDGTMSRREVDEAHSRFAAHCCAEYPKVRMWDDAP